MMNKQTIKSLLAAATFLVALQITGFAQSGQDFPEREEIRRSFRLSPGATVEVTMIYGVVDVETADTDTAEIYIVRSARRREDLASRPINIEQTTDSLIIRGERDLSQEPAKVRHRVLLKLPRRVELTVQKVNARVNIGAIDGAVRLARINGGVKVGQAVGYAEATNINGSLTMTVAGIGNQGINVSDINGAVELRFTDDLNADVSVTKFNGDVNSEMPGTTVIEKKPQEFFYARIGAGGIPILINDVNGGVRLARLQ